MSEDWRSTENQHFPEPYGLYIPSPPLPLEQFCCELFLLNLHPSGLENINCGTVFAQEAESKTDENSISFTEFPLKKKKNQKQQTTRYSSKLNIVGDVGLEAD